jgi:general secretion pathway protein D
MVERRHLRRLTGIVATAWLLAGCATVTSELRQARESFRAGDYDKTVKLLETELKSHPGNSEIRTLLFRAQLNSYYTHLAKARELRNRNDRVGADREYAATLTIFADNTTLQQEVEEFRKGPQATQPPPPTSSIQPPIALDIDKTKDVVAISLKNTPITSIFQALGKSYGISFVFDRDFRDFPHSISVENSTFLEVLHVLCMVSSTQYRVIDRHTVLIYSDIFNKKKAFDLRGIKTFYLSDIKAEDAKKLLQTVFRDEQLLIQEEPNLNALVVRADISSLQDVEAFLRRVDKPRSEVELQVEILEINRDLYHKLGADYGDGSAGLSAGVLNSDDEVNSLVNVKDLKNTNFFLTIPTVSMNVLKTDADTKLIAKPNLRGLDGEEISYQVGEERPIPETQYGSYAAGGVATTPVTTYKYRKVGVEIKVTPTVHSEGDVTLKIKMTINFVSGASASSDFPVLGNREIENQVRLKEGETNIIGGLIRDDMQRSLSGIPGLAKIPILGRLFAADEKTVRQTDLIFSITPRVIRRPSISKADLEPIWNGSAPTAQPITPPSAGRTTPEPRPRQPGTAPEDMEDQENEALGDAMISISPRETRVPVNGEASFSMLFRSPAPVASISLSGSFQGGDCQIMEVRTDALNENDVKTLKYFSGARFDSGFTFVKPDEKAPTAVQLLQLRVKFPTRGRYTLNVDQLTAVGVQRNSIPVKTTPATIEVY